MLQSCISVPLIAVHPVEGTSLFSYEDQLIELACCENQVVQVLHSSFSA